MTTATEPIPVTPPVITELRAALPDGALLTDPAGLFVYESDGFTIAKARPRAVAFPGTLGQHDPSLGP